MGEGTRQARVALFVERADWHARQLRLAFARRGARAVTLSLAACGFAPDGRLLLPGFDGGLPDAAFVKSVASGSFEQVTLRLGVLHALREAGVPVSNDARAIERCVDKSMTSFLLGRAGLATPPTWTVASPEAAAALVAREAGPGRPLVLKPLFGSQGRGLALVETAADLPPAETVAGVYHLQRYVAAPDGAWRDWRVFVIGGRAVAAMIRHGTSWRTNAAQGARCEGVAASGALAALAVAAAAATGADHAGVDLIAGRDGRLQVLEVNSNPAWAALQRVNAINIAQALADDLLARLATARPLVGA
jgi:RimK family alpha-L-glutamate ligase